MDARVNQLSRELTDAISAAVAEDSRVLACREKASAEGLELRLTLEAVIGFARRSGEDGEFVEPVEPKKTVLRQLEMSANDRRFLKSLRISADESTEKVD